MLVNGLDRELFCYVIPANMKSDEPKINLRLAQGSQLVDVEDRGKLVLDLRAHHLSKFFQIHTTPLKQGALLGQIHFLV